MLRRMVEPQFVCDFLKTKLTIVALNMVNKKFYFENFNLKWRIFKACIQPSFTRENIFNLLIRFRISFLIWCTWFHLL